MVNINYLIILDGWHIEYKLSQSKFSNAYIKIFEQTLFIYDSIVSNNFFICLPLYKINCELFKLKNKTTTLLDISEIQDALKFYNIKASTSGLSSNSTSNLNPSNSLYISMEDMKSVIMVSLYHPGDKSELLIKFHNKTNDLNSLLKFLNLVESLSFSGRTMSKYITPVDETNSYIYGKMHLEIASILIPGFEGNVFVNVILPPYHFKSKLALYTNNFPIKQVFLLPIHNRFEILKLEIVTVNHQGLFQKKEVEEKLCEHNILIPDVVNDFFSLNKTFEVEMENMSKNVKISKITMKIRIRNYTSITAAVEKCKNKKFLENCSMEKSEDDISINVLFKRLKKIIMLISDLKDQWKILFRFKYPLFSSLMCFSISIYFMFFEIRYFITHILFFIAYIIFIYSSYYEEYLSPYSEKFIFSYKNPYYFESNVVTKVDLESDEMKKENYLTQQKEKKGLIQTIIDPIKNYKEYKSKYIEILFKITQFISSLEKLKNMFVWTDPVLTFYLFLLVICLFFVVYNIEFKYIILFGLWKKFFSGILFYKKKYLNNLEVANIILRHCHIEWCNETKSKIKATSGVHPHSSFMHTNSITNETDIDNVIVIDDKFKLLIKELLEKHADICIRMEFMGTVHKLGEIKEAISKSRSLLKLKKTSSLIKFTFNNKLIYRAPVDVENYIYYFAQNIKSDYYISKYQSLSILNQKSVQDLKSFSSVSFIDTEKTKKNE